MKKLLWLNLITFWDGQVLHIPIDMLSLLWRHYGRGSVSNHQPRDCLLNRLFGRRSKKNQSSASLAFVWGIHRGPVNSPHKWPVTRKMCPFDDVIMCNIVWWKWSSHGDYCRNRPIPNHRKAWFVRVHTFFRCTLSYAHLKTICHTLKWLDSDHKHFSTPWVRTEKL